MAKIGFGKKLYIGSISIIILTILIIAVVNFYQSKKTFLSKGKTGIQNVSDVLFKTMVLKYNLQKEKLDSDLGMLMAEGKKSGNIMFVNARTADMSIQDVNTGKKEKLTLRKLIFGLNFITMEFSVVDTVGKVSNSEIAVYQMHEGRLIKVSTSRKNKDGARDVGDYFSADSGQYKSIMEDKSLLFLTSNDDGLTMQTMVPFRENLDKKIAGAYSIGSQVLTKDLKDLVQKVNVSGKGYSFICDAKGNILIHPDKAYLKMNVKDFENGTKILESKSDFVTYNHEKEKYYSFVNYFKPWDLYFVVAVSETELMEGMNKQIMLSSGISGVIALIVGILIIALMNRQLMNNMNGMAKLAMEVSKGNFNHKFEYQAKDAIGDTVDSMNEMVVGLADLIRNLNSGIETLSSSSGELNQIAEKMSEGSESTVSKVNTVASAAEEMSVNMDSVAAAMEQASTNVEVVATGTNEMTMSIEKVSQNSSTTREITSRAVKQAQQASNRVSELGRAAEEINKVTDTIKDISSQTNLLALNATIEAARAGEAGKGFAVVANEIKELAGQTAEATKDIAENIQQIQSQTEGAVTEIQEISEIINQINDFVIESASSIELQSTTTSEIAENIGQVSIGINEVNANVSESSEVSGQVAGEISGVLSEAQEINAFSSDVKGKAEVLNTVMLKLRALTEKFTI
ncbi:MAG: methyl-accepting chemotaxis protein [Desulfobacteraceae bacterium]|nr:methyl-accepting chemotaxis protein [Desulfobacteraceae bacterium]